MSRPEELLKRCEKAVNKTLRLGADEVEIFATSVHCAQVELARDELQAASTHDEVRFGVRVFRQGALGFATVNGAEQLGAACGDAIAMAAASPPSAHGGLPEPQPCRPLESDARAAIGKLDGARLVDLAAGMLSRVRSRDARVHVDSGVVRVLQQGRAIASSRGIRLCEERAAAQAQLLGVAVDGSDVGCFDQDAVAPAHVDALEAEIEALSLRFAERCLGGLGAQKGDSFRGTLLLAPEVVRALVLANLVPLLSAQAVRAGRSPLGCRVGEAIAAPAVTLIDDGRLPEGSQSGAFDREGVPTRRSVLLERGVLRSLLYDSAEARLAGVQPSGNARGDAAGLPRIGPSNLLLEPGAHSFAKLCQEPERAVLVQRWSGTASPVTGAFSGVVRGGFLLRRGERTPLRETLIAGNLFELLRSVSGVSSEPRSLEGSAFLPGLRVEDVSITAG